MRIERFTADDHDTVVAVVELLNGAQKVDAPHEYAYTVGGYGRMLRHGWDGEVPETHAAWDRGRLVGLLSLETSEWDNTHLAWIDLVLHPDARGAGRGSELWAFAERRARELGRTSIGIYGWDTEETRRFAEKHELPQKSVAVKRRQRLAGIAPTFPDLLYADAAVHAESYEVLRLAGHTPHDLVDAVADLTASINDAPIDDLDLEDEVFPADRIRGYESAQEARGHRLYRVVARHRESGELAGHTVVAVDADRPWIGDQHDTSVAAAHRGHRLGLLVKADMLRWLRDAEPQLATIDTWNMESNDFMIAVNEKLGYELLGRELHFQRDVR